LAGRVGRPGEPLLVRGFAGTGAGDGRVRAVDVSVDEGATWSPAALEGESTPFTWQRFRATVRVPKAASFTLAARATDTTGDAQLATAPKNTGGYGNNGWARVVLRPLVGLVFACALAWAAAGSAAPPRVWRLRGAPLDPLPAPSSPSPRAVTSSGSLTPRPIARMRGTIPAGLRLGGDTLFRRALPSIVSMLPFEK
jgi:hypothetical protein